MYICLVIWEKHSDIGQNKDQTVQLKEMGTPFEKGIRENMLSLF